MPATELPWNKADSLKWWLFIVTRSIWKMLCPFATTSRLTPIHQMSLAVLSRAACTSMSTTSTTTTTRDRGDRYGPTEWAQQLVAINNCYIDDTVTGSYSTHRRQAWIVRSCSPGGTYMYPIYYMVYWAFHPTRLSTSHKSDRESVEKMTNYVSSRMWKTFNHSIAILPHPKQHLNRSSHFCIAQQCDQHKQNI